MPNYSFSVSPDNQVYELNVTWEDGRSLTRRFAAMNYRTPSDIAILVNSVLRHYQNAVVANLDAQHTNVLPSVTELIDEVDMRQAENVSTSSTGRRVRPSMMENNPRTPRTSSTRRQDDSSMEDNDTPRSPDSKRRRF